MEEFNYMLYTNFFCLVYIQALNILDGNAPRLTQFYCLLLLALQSHSETLLNFA